MLGVENNCASDEHNWALIAEQVAQGVDWPISGPLHFWLMRALTGYSGLTEAQTLAFIGTWSVPLILALMVFAYGRLGVAKPAKLIVVLACSTYFLAPLFESRPQQWGQVLVLVGAVLAWRAINGLAAWWPFTLLLLLTASEHILSFAILGCMSFVAWAILYILNQSMPGALTRLLLSLGTSLLVFWTPGTPYAPMINDLKENHLQISFEWDTFSMAMIALAVSVGLALGILRQCAGRLLGGAFSILDSRPALVWTGTGLLAVCAIGLQAAILPAEAWKPYRSSFVLFATSQIGNLFFLGLSVSGLTSARQSYRQGINQSLMQAITVLLLAAGCIAFGALLASFWMLDTNWLLRALNYVVLFMAPFAALGMDKLKNAPPKWTAWLLMLLVSLMAVIRHPSIFGC